MRKCHVCKIEIDKPSRNRENICKGCGKERDQRYKCKNRRKNNLSLIINRHKISLEWYNNKIKEQNNLCAICGKPETAMSGSGKTVRPLNVDHCHETGTIRGLLCNQCNHAIGLIKENKDTLKSMINYLESHK